MRAEYRIAFSFFKENQRLLPVPNNELRFSPKHKRAISIRAESSFLFLTQ